MIIANSIQNKCANIALQQLAGVHLHVLFIFSENKKTVSLAGKNPINVINWTYIQFE